MSGNAPTLTSEATGDGSGVGQPFGIQSYFAERKRCAHERPSWSPIAQGTHLPDRGGVERGLAYWQVGPRIRVHVGAEAAGAHGRPGDRGARGRGPDL